MAGKGQYFTINRDRKYGKTTILYLLETFVKKDYFVLNLDFQMLSFTDFKSESSFIEAFWKKY